MRKKDNLEESVRERNREPINLLPGEDNKKYYGKYVAITSFNDKKVIAYGGDPIKVGKKAHKKAKEPVIFFVPDPSVRQIYNVA